MRILVLCHEYPPIGGGGGRVAQDLCKGLVGLGHEITVLTAQCGGLPVTENQEGVNVLRLRSGRKYPHKAGLLAMGGFVWASFWKSLSIITKEQPDVIHVHFAVPSGATAFALRKLTGVPYLLTTHLGDVPGGVPEKTDRWFNFLYPFTPPIWRSAGAVAAVSEFTRNLALKSYQVEIKTIRNGVDTALLDPGVVAVNQPAKIVFAGRFAPQKNLVTLVNILARIKDLPWSCTLIGDGIQRPEVEEAIARNGLHERIALPGWLAPEEVIEWFRRSDILFMPSLSEGLPVVGVQALSMGLALVVSRSGGNIDLVREGENGYLFDPYDEAGFEEALRTLLSDPMVLLTARRASRRLAGDFDLQEMVSLYEGMLTSVVKFLRGTRQEH
jgi:glycosyltransferase involved in cell wall biosynthesis